MSKAETIDALLESAIHCFAKYEYEGASLRDIANGAHVPLSTIHVYYGSKAELYIAAKRRAWSEIDHERGELLQTVLTRPPGQVPRLDEFIRALALPVVRRALSKSERDMACIHLIRTRVSEQWRFEVEEKADRTMAAWIDSLALTCPTLSRQDLVWAYSFVIGAIYSFQLVDHRYDHLIGQDVERTVEGVTGDIVAFCCAGVQAIIDRRARGAG
jgi:AcrR family transcriptional regulator